ncbi:hypothetical protein F2Q69_00022999 [Brassica cretica]|uniref:Uncharacterized protein n=1 Tax=Brassica cretica TaxID=69181 RepID=A0A8S9QBX7_BRACR|nr:hypothetical protein F2Q69_00022999 [Brassica cretica]
MIQESLQLATVEPSTRQKTQRRLKLTLQHRSTVPIGNLPTPHRKNRGLQVEPSQELFTFVDCSQRNSGGIVRDLEVQIGNALVPVDFHVLDIKLNWNSSLLLGRAFLSTSRSHRRPPEESMIQESLQLATVEPSTRQNTQRPIDSAQPKSTDIEGEESVDIRQGEWENDYYIPTKATHIMHTEEYDEDYEEERAIEQRATLDEEDRLLHHSSWKKKDGDYSIGSWTDDCYHESYAVDTTYRDQGDDELHEGFTYEELLNMQRRDETDQNREEDAWERTRFSHPIDRDILPSIDINHSTSIDINNTTSIDIRPIPKTTVSEKDKFDNQYLTPDEFGIFRDPDGYARAIDGQHQQKATKEFYDTAGGIDKSFKQRTRHQTQPSIDIDVPTSVDRQPEFGRRAFDLLGTRRFYWEEKDEYGIYRDDQGYARDLDGHTIRVHNRDISRLLEIASRDEAAYIYLPEYASSFTQTKLVPEIYTKYEINEMFYGVRGEQKKNKEAFQMKLDGVYYPLNDSINWLTTCMEEMKQHIARIQRAIDIAQPTSIDNHLHTPDATTNRPTFINRYRSTKLQTEGG